MPKIGANFSFESSQPNFDRDLFETLSDMKKCEVCDDGHIAYVKNADGSGNGKRYEFHSTNEVDDTTGKWRALKIGAEVSITRVLTTGVKIATINGTDLYAPQGGGPAYTHPDTHSADMVTYDSSYDYKDNTIGKAVKSHIGNTSNPHCVTATQIGAYVKPTGGIPVADLNQEIQTKLNSIVTPDFSNYYTKTDSDSKFVAYEDENSNYKMDDDAISTFLADGSSFAAVLSCIKSYIDDKGVDFDTDQDAVINQIIGV